ncbi:DUF3800 domain-containing protein [Bacteroides sp.]|uniref:DUF3800 domain-containing protein n=1 Tax=Bacteroides sp. TaxID=29523 RepID=UPI0025827910|nr:DUF3800 domain-containing protein [Bacteroides sp.]
MSEEEKAAGMDLSVNELRMVIELFPNKELFDIEGSFYYDETDNVRKYYLKETGVNEQIDRHFVLGGVYCKKDEELPDIEELKVKLNISNDSKEIKSKQLYRGDFLKVLDDKYIHLFLEWISQCQLYVHYTVVNLYYYSLVDIVDSLITNERSMIYWADIMKNALYHVAKRNYTAFNDILYRYNYPNLKSDDIRNFLVEIRDFIAMHKTDGDLSLPLLLDLMKDENIDKLPFIQDEKDRIFLNDLSQFYYYPIYCFWNAIHIFDHEDEIEKKHFGNVVFKKDDVLLNSYEFKDSKDEPMIQISDCIVGLICRFYKFLDEFDGNVDAFDGQLNEAQRKNLKTLCNIIKKTVDFNEALVHMIVPIDEAENYRLLIDAYTE